MVAETDYARFRGKCREMCEDECARDPSLTLVRGHYFCPVWNSDQPHWWCVRPDGEIVDPTAAQFPSKGMGVYTPFDGVVTCSQCGKEMTEDEATRHSYGNYALCSSLCMRRLVGV